MGLTLIEEAKYENRLDHLAVLKTFSEGELLAQLPFMNIAGSGLFYSAEQELPSVGFRAVNEGYTQSYGVVDQRAEAVHLFGGDVDVDRSIVDLMGPEARASQIEMKVRSMRLTLEATVINGDTSANPRAFDGLSKRLQPGDAMAIDNAGSGGAGTSTAPGAPLDFDRLDELIDSVNAYGGSKVLVMSKAMRRQLNAGPQHHGRRGVPDQHQLVWDDGAPLPGLRHPHGGPRCPGRRGDGLRRGGRHQLDLLLHLW